MELLISIIFILSTAVGIQEEKEKWQRVYTGDDSIIEMNVSRVTFGDKKIGRVRFHTILSRPQTLKEIPGVKYKSRVETIEFKCIERQYRVYAATLLDVKGKPIQSYEVEVSEEWKSLKAGGMMEKLFRPACKLIDDKRRNP